MVQQFYLASSIVCAEVLVVYLIFTALPLPLTLTFSVVLVILAFDVVLDED